MVGNKFDGLWNAHYTRTLLLFYFFSVFQVQQNSSSEGKAVDALNLFDKMPDREVDGDSGTELSDTDREQCKTASTWKIFVGLFYFEYALMYYRFYQLTRKSNAAFEDYLPAESGLKLQPDTQQNQQILSHIYRHIYKVQLKFI